VTRYEAAITSCVRTGVAEKLTMEQLSQPLVDQLAVIIVGTTEVTGAKLDDLVEIIRHQLDQRVSHHAHQIRSR